MKKLLLLGLMFIVLISSVSAVCSLVTLNECNTQALCDGVNGTFYNNTCYDFKSEMFGYWSFDEDYDADYGSLNFTNYGTVLSESGKSGKSVDFSTDYMTLPDWVDIQNFSVSIWINADDVSSNAHIYSKYYDSGSNTRDVIIYVGSDSLTTRVVKSELVFTEQHNSINSQEWYHVVLSYNGTHHLTFINGELNNVTLLAYPREISENDLTMGKRHGFSDQYYDGRIDEMGIWSTSLSLEEVQALYNTVNPLTYNASACNLNQLGNCDTQVKCEAINGTFYNNTCYDFRTDMIGYYSFDTDLNDDYASNNWSANGNAQQTSTGCKLNGCVDFDGASDYLDLTDITIFDGQSNIAFSYWAYMDTFSAWNPTLNMESQSVNLYISSGTKLQSGLYATGTQWVYPTPISAGNWYHEVLTYDGVNIYVYHNGVLFGKGVLTGVVDNTANFQLGGDTTNNRWFNGRIDEVVFWNKNISASEVSALYNNGTGLNPLNYTEPHTVKGVPTNYSYLLESNTAINVNVTAQNGTQTILLTPLLPNRFTTIMDIDFSVNVDVSNIVTGVDSVKNRMFTSNLTLVGALSNYSILLERKQNTGLVYVCPAAKTLNDVNPSCVNKTTLVSGGDVVNGMWATNYTQNGTFYYRVFNITGTGLGEGNYSISGSVHSVGGTALSGMTILLINQTQSTTVLNVTTNSTGGFIFTGLDNITEYTVVAFDPITSTTNGNISTSVTGLSSPLYFILYGNYTAPASTNVPLVFGPSGPVDTCTYTTGNWFINASDNCVINTNVNLKGNSVTVSGDGNLTLYSNLYNFSSVELRGVSTTKRALIYCYGGCFKDE